MSKKIKNKSAGKSLTESFNKSLSLQGSKGSLAALGYVFRRLVSFEAAWVTYFPDFQDKITNGLALGASASVLATLNNRLKEQNTTEAAFYAPSQAWVKAFDDMQQAGSLDDIRKFVTSVTASALRETKKLQRKIDPLYDYPSIFSLRAVAGVLEDKLAILESRGWKETVDVPSFAQEGSAVLWDKDALTPALMVSPARPAHLQQNDQNIKNAPFMKLIETKEGMQRILHSMYADIEVMATEVCACNIANFGHELPLQFTFDMARQSSDESRHALMVDEMMQKYGTKLGDYTYTNRVWTAYTKGQDLGEKLAIQQIIDEGNGLDASALAIDAFKARGMVDIAKLYEFLQADETNHCAYGNRWLNWLVKGDMEKYESVIDSALQKSGSRLPAIPKINEEGRRAAEYPEWFIQKRLKKA